jgi:hypothetical protein
VTDTLNKSNYISYFTEYAHYQERATILL